MAIISQGLVHLYVGDGKGKTTAAVGLAVRAKGAQKRVLIAQFLKGKVSSELGPLERLGIDVIRTEEILKFVFQMTAQELADAGKSCNACLDKVERALFEGRYDLVVLDEVVDAVNTRLIREKRLLDVVNGRGGNVELVMTGRDPSDAIVQAADYITVMTARRHPYQRGVPSRKGIEY